MKPNCVEMYDGTSFCGRSYMAIHVGQRDWQDDDGSSLTDATCLRCLAAIQALGDQAAAVRAQALDSGATDEQQSAWFVEEKRRVAGIPADRTLTIAALGDIFKQAYDRSER